MSLSGPQAHQLDSTHINELPEHLREKVADVINEGLAKPDPKIMN